MGLGILLLAGLLIGVVRLSAVMISESRVADLLRVDVVRGYQQRERDDPRRPQPEETCERAQYVVHVIS